MLHENAVQVYKREVSRTEMKPDVTIKFDALNFNIL